MTDIFNDSIDVNLQINGLDWNLFQAKVELSLMDTPNYTKLRMIPAPSTIPALPDNIDDLVGADFELSVDTTMISDRDTNANEDSLLFTGNVANISPVGDNSYEAIAYDPSHQPFAEEGDGGIIENQYIEVGMPEFTKDIQDILGTNYKASVIKADDLIKRIMEELEITDFEIELEEGGVTVVNNTGEFTGGYNKWMFFSKERIKIEEALQKTLERTRSSWWFDKEGTFHFGVPRPTRHELKFIKSADAGKATPPYQSVRVIGSGVASQEGYERSSMEIENPIVVKASIAQDEKGNPIANFGETKEPVFEYKNLEISTREQAENTAKSLISDLADQQADGTVTVVGFPEIIPKDGIVMPQAQDPLLPNFSEEQPMGGGGYNVYKVQHHLNDSDGFITKIHVSGVTGVTRTVVSTAQAATSYDVTDIYRTGGSSGAEVVR